MKSPIVYITILAYIWTISMMQAQAEPRVKRSYIRVAKGLKKFANFKKMKKMLKTVSTGMMAKSIIDEIGGASHGQDWNFEYFDHKFQLIGGKYEFSKQ